MRTRHVSAIRATLRQLLLPAAAEFTDQGSLSFTKSMALGELCALHAVAGEWSQAHDYARQIAQAQADKPLLSGALTGWYETEALLRGGDEELARAEVEQVAGIVGNNCRYRLILLRSQAVLAQWDGDAAQTITHLEAALALAQEMELPGDEWPILGELGRLYAERGDPAQAQQAYQEAAAIIRRLAATIDEANLRAGFLAAGPVRSMLERCRAV